MPRILHLVGTIDPAAGGPTEVIRMLVRYAPAGHENEVATTDDPAATFLAGFPCPVHALGSAQKQWRVPALLDWLIANRSRFDGVFVHGLWEYTGIAARKALAGRVPYAVFPHGMLDPYFRTHRLKHLKKQLYWLLEESHTLRRAHRVLFTTNAERDLARNTFFPSRWTPAVTPIGCEPPPPFTESQREAFAVRIPELEGRRYLLFLGRIHPKKGCDLLIDAFTEPNGPAARDPGLDLVVAGPDPDGWGASLRAGLAASAFAHRVHWPGMLRGDAKYGALAGCEAFVLTSHQENFGVAVAEAMAAGRPVLLTHPVNIADDIAAGGGGLVDHDTPEGVRHLLAAWLSLAPAARETMGQRAAELFRELYDMRRNTEAILRIFEQPTGAAS